MLHLLNTGLYISRALHSDIYNASGYDLDWHIINGRNNSRLSCEGSQ